MAKPMKESTYEYFAIIVYLIGFPVVLFNILINYYVSTSACAIPSPNDIFAYLLGALVMFLLLGFTYDVFKRQPTWRRATWRFGTVLMVFAGFLFICTLILGSYNGPACIRSFLPYGQNIYLFMHYVHVAAVIAIFIMGATYLTIFGYYSLSRSKKLPNPTAALWILLLFLVIFITVFFIIESGFFW
jgi:hypothetical protein